MKLDTATKTLFRNLLKGAEEKNLVSLYPADRRNFRQRANRALKRNLQEPGDCAGDLPLLCGLAIAQAHVGIGPGWIPETQRIGCEIADLLSR